MPEVKKILVVDDQPVVLELVSDMLSDLGFSVATASNAGDAVNIIERDKIDIAFLDAFLGPERGIDLLPRMSEIQPDLHFVIMTGNGSTDLAIESLKMGASDFLTKPFFESDVIRSIDYVARKRELEHERRACVSLLESRVQKKTEELNQAHFSMLASLVRAVEKRDQGTFGHSVRVSYYAGAIGETLRLPESERSNLQSAAILHDIGKIGISDAILAKRGPLTADETKIARSHPQNGVEILLPLKQYHSILLPIKHHHERYNGGGYPCGLAGDTIPLLARIIAVADAYDAIRSERPYRGAGSHKKAAAELRAESGRQFDPVIVRALLASLEEDHARFDRLSDLPVPSRFAFMADQGAEQFLWTLSTNRDRSRL